jgi:hypothetical protein
MSALIIGLAMAFELWLGYQAGATVERRNAERERRRARRHALDSDERAARWLAQFERVER